MTRSNRNRNNQPATPSEERDWVLTVLLAIINLGSGTTTILGAMQVLPRALALGLGGTIQVMLFLLLGGFTVKHAPFRKWVAVLVLTFMSVYTSFFTYYKQLTGESTDKLAHDKAVLAHQNFVRDVYIPIKDNLKQLEDEAISTRAKQEAEKQRGTFSGLGGGDGDNSRELDRQALELETKANNFKRTVDELRPKFEYDLKELQPKEILEKDRQALAEVPREWQQNYSELKREMYIDAELDVSLLTPYYKVKRFEDGAIASMGIALAVDGIAIMLGTAIAIKRQRQSPGQLIADWIRKYKTEVATVKRAAGETVNIGKSTENDPDELNKTVEIVTLKLRGKGSKFLTEFYNAIAVTEPHTINYQALNGHPNQTFAFGFRSLVDKLREPSRGWVVNSQTGWVVVPKHYHKLTAWLTEEIRRHTQEEANSGLGEDWLLSDVKEADVSFRIPSINNSR